MHSLKSRCVIRDKKLTHYQNFGSVLTTVLPLAFFAENLFDCCHAVSALQWIRQTRSIPPFRPNCQLGLFSMVFTMERIQRIKELYRELNEIHEKMKPFLIPRTVQHREWTQEDANQHLKLHQRQGEIIKELADLERGHI
jgi:hypothetical protein